ncbi:MAG: LemA protein [Chitinophagales bacterium]|jgi:LemA protein
MRRLRNGACKVNFYLLLSQYSNNSLEMIMKLIQVVKFSALLVVGTILSGCGINNIPTLDEQVKSSWAQVENQYQRRADLVPNLVATVKGFAAQEKDTLTAVVEARAKVGTMQIDANMLNNPQAMQNFEKAQGALSGALSRLMVVAERYPDLKSNQNFLTLQSQLEGTENRIAIARKDYIASVQGFNTEIRTFPGRLWYSIMYSDLDAYEAYQATTEGAQAAPQVQF